MTCAALRLLADDLTGALDSAAAFGAVLLPGVIGGQIKFASATRNANPAADPHQPIVFGEGLADLAGQTVERCVTLVDGCNEAVQCCLGDGRIAAKSVQDLLLFFKILEHV